MKIRHIKRRLKRPEFRRIGLANVFEFKSTAAVARFFGPTEEDNRRAAEFFGMGTADAQHKGWLEMGGRPPQDRLIDHGEAKAGWVLHCGEAEYR